MNPEKRYFNKGINADDDFELIGPGEYVNGHNMRFGSTDDGSIGPIETINGTKEIKNLYLFDGANRGYGGCEDADRNRILFFNYNSQAKYGIYCFDKKAGVIYKVLMYNQVIGGLTFGGFIHSCGVANGCLYWTDSDFNEPRRIDIDACIIANHPFYKTSAKAYNFPLERSVITIIRRPPSLPPTIQKGVYSTLFSSIFVSAPPSYAVKPAYNKIKDAAFRFAWRYNYFTNETSVISDYSLLSDRNAPGDDSDTVKITLPVADITQDVKSVDIIAQNADTGKCYIVYTWDVSKPLFDGSTVYQSYKDSYFFTDYQTGEYIDKPTADKQYDTVPLFGETLEFAKNRLKIGNYVAGYGTPSKSSLKCVAGVTSSGLTTITSSYKNYSVEGWYYNSLHGYLALTTYSYVLLEILNVAQPGYYKLGAGSIPHIPGPTTDSFTNFTFVGQPGGVQTAILAELNAAAPSGYVFVVYRWGNFTDNVDITLTDVVLNNTISFTDAQYKNGGIYETGIFFKDDYGRRCGVYRGNRIAMPERKFADASVGGTSIHWSLSNQFTDEIPLFATKYHIVRTKCLYTRNFIQGKPAANEATPPETRVIYVKKDATTDAITYTNTFPSYTDKDTKVAIDISSLSKYGIGYSFQANDRIKLFTDLIDEHIEMEIVGQDSKYIWCPLRRLESVAAITLLSAGSGYTNGTYTNVPTINTIGTGIGLTLNITVAGGVVTAVTVNKKGIGYAVNDEITTTQIVGGTGFSIKVATAKLPTNTLFEIYSPYEETLNEPFYEVSQCFKILNPGTPLRMYSQLTGTLPGDVYIVTRRGETTNFLAESMSPNDSFWQIWNTSASRPNFIDKIGQQRLNAICFSDVYLQGTRVNGLSSFDALNKKDIPNEYGPLRRLKLGRKVQTSGTVLLAICESETASIYLGETEYFDTAGNSNVVISDQVLGTVKALAGSMGTLHPSSVFEYNGMVMWADKRNSSFVRYGNNGLFQISKNKLTRVSNHLFNDIGDDQLIIGGVDPYHKEFLFSIPKTLDTPPKGLLEDYQSTPYPYDMYDGLAKSLVYKSELDFWGAPFQFPAETFIRLGNELYSIHEGVLHLHNQNTGTIYGKPYTSGIGLTCNQVQGAKSFAGIGIESNVAPLFTHLRTEKPDIQSSDLVKEDFKPKEGVLYAPFFRDRLDVNAGDSFFKRQMRGKKMNGKCLLLYMTFNEKASLKTSNINFELKEGHFINI